MLVLFIPVFMEGKKKRENSSLGTCLLISGSLTLMSYTALTGWEDRIGDLCYSLDQV